MVVGLGVAEGIGVLIVVGVLVGEIVKVRVMEGMSFMLTGFGSGTIETIVLAGILVGFAAKMVDIETN